MSDWIDLSHSLTWVMDFNGFKTLLFCQLILFNFLWIMDFLKFNNMYFSETIF